ncbi:hypothetical protein NE237_016440 [Protea cynaroides]|uniref:Uncharacterized protein n=1 Tax=Protea cynaroides TaxID=273540 RepID=A0A9Q0K667_9MAGN|nr:hypothetical protein NE237_016440 [Protea cynaroides]
MLPPLLSLQVMEKTETVIESFAKVKYAKNVETGDNVVIKVLDKDHVLRHKMVEQGFSNEELWFLLMGVGFWRGNMRIGKVGMVNLMWMLAVNLRWTQAFR